MGLGGISGPQLLIILAIVVLLFGTKRLRSLGTDLGAAIKGFKKSVSDEKQDDEEVADPKKVGASEDATFSDEKSKSTEESTK